VTDRDDIPKPPRVVVPKSAPEPQYSDSLRRQLALLGAERFGKEPGHVRVDDYSEHHGWCRSHRIFAVWATPWSLRVFVAPDGHIAHIVAGHPQRLGELTTEMMAPASAILRAAGLLERSAPVSLLASSFLVVMCNPPPRVATNKTASSGLFFGPIETWTSPSGESGRDVLQRCSRDPEIEWQDDHFRLRFCSYLGAFESWDVVGNGERLLEAHAEIEVPQGLFPQPG